MIMTKREMIKKFEELKKSQNVTDSSNDYLCYRCKESTGCKNCKFCDACRNLVNCKRCLLCSDLKEKKEGYWLLNKEVSKEEFEEARKVLID
jgi:hypothetical protein